MDLLEAAKVRTSRRTYRPVPLTDKDKAALQAVIDRYSGSGYRMEIVQGSVKAGYGLFSGVQNVILMIAEHSDPDAEEKLGYFGELVVLEATAQGYGTCWMGMYDTKSAPVTLRENEHVVIAITIGYVDAPKLKDKLIRSVVRRKGKSMEQLTRTDSNPPDWFIRGVEAAQAAPSAVNRQPVIFAYQNGVTMASVEDITAHAMAIDLGIAKAHFALGAGGTWNWGNAGTFVKDGDSTNG